MTLGRAYRPTLSAVPFKLVVKGLSADAQNLRRARFVAARELDGLYDQLPFHFVQGCANSYFEVSAVHLRDRLELFGQVVLSDDTPATYYQCPLDNVT